MICIASLAALTTLFSCGGTGNPRVADESTKFADTLNTSSAVNPATDQPSASQVVYIDSSLSMNGFVGANSSSRTKFDEVIDVMPDVLPGCTVYRYGQTGQLNEPDISQITTRAEFDGRLHDPNTYHMGFNPDDVLFRDLASQKKPSFSVILTDGVESDQNGAINTVVVNSIRAWLKSGNVLGILVFRSKFSGDFYSELRRKMIGKITAEARPFYAFVMATSRREFTDFVEKLKRRYGSLQSIVFSDDALKSTIALPVNAKANYENESPPAKPYYWQMMTVKDLPNDGRTITQNENTQPANSNKATPADLPLGYEYDFEITRSYPIKALGFNLSVKEHLWDRSQSTFQREPVKSPNEITPTGVQQTKNGESTRQTFTVPPEDIIKSSSDGDFQFYEVDCSIYIKEVADEVSSISTRDDSTADNANKTYRFQELVLAIMDVHLKDRISPKALPRLYVTASRL
jgi:hypothetical protein